MFTQEYGKGSFADKLEPNEAGFSVSGSSLTHELRFVEVVPSGDEVRVGAAVDRGGNQSYSPATGKREDLHTLVHTAIKGAVGLRIPELTAVQIQTHQITVDAETGARQVSVGFEHHGDTWTETAETNDPADHRAYRATLTAMMNGYKKAVERR